MSVSPEEFLEQLRHRVQSSGGAEWLASRIDGDAVIVLFRCDSIDGTSITTGPVEGVRLVFAEFAELILGPGEHEVSDILTEAALEIVEPHPLGERLEVPWADGLWDKPRQVYWTGYTVAAVK